MKPLAPIVLLAAMLFAVGNLAHSYEHDYAAGSAQAHDECNHCSSQDGAVVGAVQTGMSASPSKLHREAVVSCYAAALALRYQVRAPPLC
jgi:hypothetical protein